MKTFLLLLILSLAQTQVWADDTLLGKWTRTFDVSHELTLSMRLEVTPTQSIFGMTCDVNGQTGDVQVTVPTKIEGWEYHILQKAVDAKDVNDFDCRLVLFPGVWSYDLAGDELKLVTNNGELIFMKREK